MKTVTSTRCTYTAHDGLPELTGGVPVEIPDELLPEALLLAGVVEQSPDLPPAPPPAAPPVPDPEPAAVPEPPAVAEPDSSIPPA